MTRLKFSYFKLPSLWTAFLAYGFFTILFSSTLLLFFIYFLSDLGVDHEDRPAISLFLLLAMSIVIASFISFFVGRKVFTPINAISHAMTNVAKGDFSIRLDYSGRVEELTEISDNFNVMVQELGNIEALRNDFVVTISHEFKTPLAAIEGYATILKNHKLSEAQSQEFFQKIIESIKQLSNLSSNVLMISNLENREMITARRRFRVDEQIRIAVLMLEPLWAQKQLTLNIELDNAMFFGNEELMMHVWLNLISNAIKFTPSNGEISISLRKGKSLRVTVSDTGIGIPYDLQAHIFDKFYKANRSGEGNGLGLALVKRIVTLSHGTVNVESEPGSGSSFTVSLPLN
ncbi:MAG: histidine kinase [Bacillota bacterium]|jgi:signal transduction histidine kinase|nr:histidine kinase [Bacillota bacterium]